jgi:hypothetical protein
LSIYDDVQAAATEVGTSAAAAAQRVLDAIAAQAAAAQEQIAAAQAALQAEIDAEAANAAVLTGVVSTLTDADATIDGIAASAEPPVA